MEESADEEEDDELRKTKEYCIKAFLLFLVGVTIFSNKTNKHVNVIWLIGMQDLYRVHTWSWGEMTLAYLYTKISEATDPTIDLIVDYMSMLKVVIFYFLEHIINVLILLCLYMHM